MKNVINNVKVAYSRQFLGFSSIILILIAVSGFLFFENMRNEEQVVKISEQFTKVIHEADILNAEVPDPVFKYAPLMIDAGDPRIKELASSLRGKEEIYLFVRNKIEYSEKYDTRRTATEVLESRQGDCLGHADLLAALLRADGYTEDEVVVSMGYVSLNGERRHHAWVEFNDKGKWIVLDASKFLGKFEFGRWDIESFYQTFQAESYVKFNDKHLQEHLER
ncbi:MAG: transglutaminase-like domain-containing protein [Candidatus Methanoperedens sp.]|nr:transglutaminase-like domain-containing protein [Candidatus Methanoperedens sp.]